jgi:hypothetical protein
VAAGLVLERTITPEALADADDETPSNSKKPATVRRFLPTRHHRMSVDGMDNFTDSEATMVASPRSRAKQRMFGFGGGVPEETDAIDLTDPAPEDGTPLSPHSRMRRLNTNNLRIRLPEPISQHFANGWPHAGSWQDALRANDVFEERPKTEHRGSNHESRPESVHQPMSALNLPAAAMLNSAPPSTRTARREDSGSTDTDMANVARRPNRPPILQANRSSSETPVERPPARMKRKARKTKRYRQAQMPPTPGGPSYSPMVQRGTHTLGGQWNKPAGLGVGEINPFDNINPFDRIDEEYNLSPQNSMSEKDTKPSWAWFWGGRKPKHSALDHLSFHQRVRRMLFLDARVTIYIRLFNLAVVTTLLGELSAAAREGPQLTLQPCR